MCLRRAATLALPGASPALWAQPSSSACSAVNGTEVQATGYNAGVRTEQLPAMRAFLSDASTGQWQRVVILDVGSNNGNWAKSIAQLCQAHRKAPCETVMFEPQPQFKERLDALVRRAWPRRDALRARGGVARKRPP